MKQFTDINVLLDRSGSMHTIKIPMENAFNEFVLGHRKNPSTRLTLVQFDTSNDQQVIYESRPITEVGHLELNPIGGTPLLDALCKFIDRTGIRYANMPESQRPDQVLFVIITDGEENSSRTYKREDVKSRIQHQISKYGWNFIFLGANQDAFAEAATLGIPAAFTINYAANQAGTCSVFGSIVTNTTNYASQVGASRGLTKSLNFTKEQRDEATGKTSGTSSSS